MTRTLKKTSVLQMQSLMNGPHDMFVVEIGRRPSRDTVRILYKVPYRNNNRSLCIKELTVIGVGVFTSNDTLG